MCLYQVLDAGECEVKVAAKPYGKKACGGCRSFIRLLQENA